MDQLALGKDRKPQQSVMGSEQLGVVPIRGGLHHHDIRTGSMGGDRRQPHRPPMADIFGTKFE